jgi:hypothetical protein
MRRKLIVFFLVLLLLVSAGTALAQTQDYDLGWFAVAGGGGASSGGGYELSATGGQSAAGELSGGEYSLQGGFWGLQQAGLVIYLPLVVR